MAEMKDKTLEDIEHKIVLEDSNLQEKPQVEIFTSYHILKKAITEFEESSKSNFICLKKTKNFGNEEFQANQKSRIHWEGPSSKKHIFQNFTGIPYVIVGTKNLQCHLGQDSGFSKKRKYAEHRDLKQITQNTEKRKVTMSLKLRNAIQHTTEKVKGTHGYVTQFPLLSEHINHESTGELANIREKVDPRVQDKIINLYRSGVRTVNEILRHTNTFVKELFPPSDLPEESRRRFYPTRKDISNLLTRSRQEGRNSVLDQEQLLDQLNVWKVETPDLNQYCRLSTMPDDLGNPQTFLFAYQTAWQKKILKRYGNQITFLDATYRTTRYALPLFFLCVRTNVCYVVVGTFVTENETSASIQEALEIFKSWNKAWNPNCFLVDFCLEEMNAISRIFQDTKILLCDFHREKAWTEWVNKRDHGVYENRKTVLTMLRKIAFASSVEEYNMALQTLTDSNIWKKTNTLKKWFSHKWMPQIQKWAHLYRTSETLIAIHTNNGLERQNEVLKLNYLEGYKNCMLVEMITVLHSKFFPNAYKKYVQLNLLSSQCYRKYSEDVPNFLRNRPRDFVTHVMKRLTSNITSADIKSRTNSSGIFDVNSETEPGKTYTVNVSEKIPSCNCIDWKKHFMPCKHMCAIFSFQNEWSWEKLDPAYIHNPLFVLDTDCLIPETETRVDNELKEWCSPSESTSSVAKLPLRKRTKRTCLIRSCTQKIKRLLDCVYLLKDEDYLTELETSIDFLLAKSLNKIPTDNGLPLIETPQKKEIPKNVVPLPKRLYGKPKQLGSERFGSKVEQLKLDVWETVKDSVEEGNKDDSKWVTINHITLSQSDKKAILNCEWLDDKVINIFQYLIATAFPSISGLFDTVILAHDSVSCQNSQNILQIHHVGAHWVVSQSSGTHVTVFDSFKTRSVPEMLRKQLLKVYDPLFSGEYCVLNLDLVCCQKQDGVNDCGAFAIANAVALAYGLDLKHIHFRQEEMRKHIISCLQIQKISMFPHDTIENTIVNKRIQLTKHCLCNLHKPKSSMVECFTCKQWFHFQCVGLKKNDRCVTSKKQFHCLGCKE